MSDLLNLDGKELDRELTKIIKESAKRRRFWTEKEVVVVKWLYEAGLTDIEIAKVVGRSNHAVRGKIGDFRRK